MSTQARALDRLRDGNPRAGAVELAVAVWAAVVLAATAGVLDVPRPRVLAASMPLALLALGLSGVVRPTERERRATVVAAVVAGGVVGGWIVLQNAEWALAAPAILVAAAASARWPVASVVVLFGLAGAYQSVIALTGVQVYKVVDVVLAGLLVGAVWRSVVDRHDRRRLLLWPGVVALALYVAVTAFQVPLADTLRIGRDSFHASTWYLLGGLGLVLLALSEAQRRAAARAVIAVAALVGAYAVLRWIIGPAAAEEEAVLAKRAAFNFVDGKLVLFGSFATGHHLAVWTAAIVPFCFAAGLGERSPRWQALAVLACGLCTAALVGSKVRAGFAGLVLGLLVVVVLLVLSRGFAPLRSRALAAGGVALVAIVITFVALASGPEGTRYANILNPTADQAFLERTYKWGDALADVDEHPWGQGLGTAGISQVELGRFVSLGKTDVDNSYLKIALDQGIALTLLYVAGMLLLLAALARRAIAAATPRAAAVAAGSAGALAAFMLVIATGVYIEGLTALATWLVVGLGIERFSRA
jgi:hypothetical protein